MKHSGKKIWLTFFTVLCLVFAVSAGGSASGSVVVDRIIAIVNDEIIMLSDLQREEARMRGEKIDERLLLDEMINKKLQLTAAKRASMDVTDKELNDALADIMKRNALDDKQFQAALAKEGLTLEQYRAELKEQMTLSRVFNKFVRTGLTVEEPELREFYQRNIKDYAMPEEIRVRQIVLKIDENATEAQVNAVREKALAVSERAKRGEDFVRLVKEVSQGESASNNGDLGYLQRGHVLPEIDEASRALKPGEVSGPFRCGSAFHVIRLEDVRTSVKPFEQVKEEIANTIYQQKLENTYRAWLQTLRSESNIENRL
jgi:peptidyl-prolyl cis-trans isomerase SurA